LHDHSGEAGLVVAVHANGNRGWHDVGRVAVPDIELMYMIRKIQFMTKKANALFLM